jgi:hypothetical protein
MCDDDRQGVATIRLYNDQTGEEIGELGEDDLQFLIDNLEEEDAEDRAYYINQDTVTLLRSEGASQDLLVLLDKALGTSGEAEVRWSDA